MFDVTPWWNDSVFGSSLDDLEKVVHDELLSSAPSSVTNQDTDTTIPYTGQIFQHENSSIIPGEVSEKELHPLYQAGLGLRLDPFHEPASMAPSSFSQGRGVHKPIRPLNVVRKSLQETAWTGSTNVVANGRLQKQVQDCNSVTNIRNTQKHRARGRPSQRPSCSKCRIMRKKVNYTYVTHIKRPCLTSCYSVLVGEMYATVAFILRYTECYASLQISRVLAA